ncbi:MAG: hypothetical protein B9S33_13285 [Pedosphaera sp. Tous-C6FEB]|nr:MAG: hypothetical protein B9S33_13285 [Pedosphaera sp. Tous-C6FEB]
MPQADSNERSPWWFLPFLLLLAFGFLGTRGLNEPDEGRYAEIAREMVETGNWLVPHIWYVPHLDKPPFTYWAVAASLSVFGVNEWAARLPLALAGLSTVWAVFLLVRSLAGAAAARGSALVLGTTALFWVMARMLTTDMFLTQFIAWAIYFFWRSWRSLDELAGPSSITPQPSVKADEDAPDPAADARGLAARRSFGWQLAAWAAMAGGALTKGPIALVIPLLAFGTLLWWRRKVAGARLSVLLLGAVAGGTLFSVLAVPWYWMVWGSVPHSFDYMVRGQVVGHALQAAAKNRAQPFWFFVPVLLAGFLPWTPLLGWLWRRDHWRSLDARTQEGWLLLSVWAGATFVLFSLNSAKLMHYILPMFPPLAALVALRWPAVFSSTSNAVLVSASSPMVWRAVVTGSVLVLLAFPLACRFAFKIHDQVWIKFAPIAAGLMLAAVAWESRKWTAALCIRWAAGLAAVCLLSVALLAPLVETELRSNQTLKPLALALKREFQPGCAVVVRQRIPQGLPFYAHPVISAQHRPYFSGLPEHRMPLAFPGNRDRLGDRLLKDDAAYARLLQSEQRVLVVGFKGAFVQARFLAREHPLRLVLQSGDWELFTNQ